MVILSTLNQTSFSTYLAAAVGMTESTSPKRFQKSHYPQLAYEFQKRHTLQYLQISKKAGCFDTTLDQDTKNSLKTTPAFKRVSILPTVWY